VAITAAWISALEGDPLGAHRFLYAAERGSFEGHLPDGSASLASACTLLRAMMGARGVEQMHLDATAAASLEPLGGPWYPAAMFVLGVSHLLTGHTSLAVKELDLSARLGGQAQRPAASAALAELALLAAERGDWVGAERDADRALDMIVTGGIQGQVSTILAYTAAARVAAHDGDQARARGHVGTALRLYASPSPVAFPWMSAQVAINLGHIFLDLGDFDGARFRAEEARSHLARLLTERRLSEQLRELSDRVARAGGHGRITSAMTLTTAEMRVLQLLPTHLSLSEIGDQLHISRNTVKSQVAAVYRKLGCSTRTEAVGRGRDLGLLEP
jgi:LuxR family transcriptional regulator, maltose regulon positive regulatory protein